MSRDKHIEEMAKDICHAPTCEIRKNGGTCYKYCKAYIYAFRAINAGYRKAEDVAREIFEEIEKIKQDSHCEDCLGEWHEEGIFFGGIAELKKKYITEDGK